MDGFMHAASLLPEPLRSDVYRMGEAERCRCEEIRLRRGRPASALVAGREKRLSDRPASEAHLRFVMEMATHASLHAAEAQLREGFLMASGGVRVGVCGVGVISGDGLTGLRSVTSLAIRIPRAVRGCADGIWKELAEGPFRSTLVVSPPGAGKTTLLRELIRRLSDEGVRVCVADERGELAGSDGGFEVGAHTDVLTCIPKACAAVMLLRSMNPQVIAMDEIADPAEAESLLLASNCGVELLASVHGQNAEDAARRTACRALMDAHVFRRCITISSADGVRSYRAEDLI